jgi:hypothetical protein
VAERGIVYVATKKEHYIEEAFLSAESVKARCPDLSITLFTDFPTHPLCTMKVFDSIEPIVSVSGIASDWAEGKLDRLICLARTPYVRTLHLDTDTRILTDELPRLFELLDAIDVAMVETAIDDSFSRKHYGERMFNGGFVLYRRNEKTLRWLQEWAVESEHNFWLSEVVPLPSVPALAHVSDERVRRKLLGMDQISLVQMLSPAINKFNLELRILPHPWNHRGSRLPESNPTPIKILHSPALRQLTHADILAVEFQWRKKGHAEQANKLLAYIASKYPRNQDDGEPQKTDRPER